MIFNIHTHSARKIKNMQLELIREVCFSLVCAGLLCKVAYVNLLSQPLGIDDGLVRTEFRSLTKLMHAKWVTNYDGS